ncbi:hypothetical protein OIV83_002416 [Microbotryomycetes sp. JL201]|nr:hypothetical protein OIV83_002416 [Microbotryomycetes sp. JL201]
MQTPLHPRLTRLNVRSKLPNGLGARGDEERDPVLYPDRPLHVLLLATGSVASVKVPLIAHSLRKFKHVDVHIAASSSALHFFSKQEVESDSGVTVWTDEDEWAGWSEIGDPILHIELRRWADIVLIAPCSANTLAKISNGLCDNIVTAVLRAMPCFVPIMVFPAMNTHMWSHPLTAKHLAELKDELGYEIHGPIPKMLACGDVGLGAMYEWSDIVKLVEENESKGSVPAF